MSADSQRNQNLLWTILTGAVLWGLLLGLGAYLQEPSRGLVVLITLAIFASFWSGLLLLYQWRRARKEGSGSGRRYENEL